MSVASSATTPSKVSLVAPALHSLHECTTPEAFLSRFEAATGCSVRNVADSIVAPDAEKAVFVVGSIPLGMGTSASDVDFIVLVDSKSKLLSQKQGVSANTNQHLAFANESSSLVVGTYVTLTNGIAVEVQVAVTESIGKIYKRLRGRGPELSTSEINTLGRLSTGWLLWQSESYVERNAVTLKDPALDVWCATRNFVSALIIRRKAMGSRDLMDIPLAFHLGRASVEMAYLAYFASEGLCYLGDKWLAQIGHARGAAERIRRHPLLKQSVHLLFPVCGTSQLEATQYLQEVSEFLTAMRDLIEQKTLFRIAFHACPQIFHIH
jgi:hypothetical protein